jgi:hypothetical protein
MAEYSAVIAGRELLLRGRAFTARSFGADAPRPRAKAVIVGTRIGARSSVRPTNEVSPQTSAR